MAAEADGPDVLLPSQSSSVSVVPPSRTSCCFRVPPREPSSAHLPKGPQQICHTQLWQAAGVIKHGPQHRAGFAIRKRRHAQRLCHSGDKFSWAHCLGSYPCCHQHFTADTLVGGGCLAWDTRRDGERSWNHPQACLKVSLTCSQTPDSTPSPGHPKPKMQARHGAEPWGPRYGPGYLEAFTEQQRRQMSNRITAAPQLGPAEREGSRI